MWGEYDGEDSNERDPFEHERDENPYFGLDTVDTGDDGYTSAATTLEDSTADDDQVALQNMLG